MRSSASLGFAVLHAATASYAIVTLCQRATYPELLYVGVSRLGLDSTAGIVFTAVVGVLLLTFTAALALSEVRKSVQHWRRREAEPEALLRVRALFYIATACILVNALILSTPETSTGPFRLRYPIQGALTAAFGYSGFVLWYSRLARFRQVVPLGVRRGMDVAAMNVSLFLILADIGLRVMAILSPSALLVTDSMPSRVRRTASRMSPGTLRFGFPINRGGHYDTEFIANAARPGPLVVSIGDSFSYGTVPHVMHFTTVAEEDRPGVEIYNMGYPGIGPRDYLYLLEDEALPLAPDLIVVQLFVGNDLSQDLLTAARPRWYDADSYLTAIVWHRLRIMSQAKMARGGDGIPGPDDPTREVVEAKVPYLANPLLEPPSVTNEVFLELEKKHAEEVCLPRPEMYERFFGVLEEIERAAGTIPLKFVLIPEEFQVEDDVWEEVKRRSGKPLDRDYPQHTIVGWMNARGRPVMDLLPLLRAAEPATDGRRHVYHLRDMHFNNRGNAIAGHALAGFLDPLSASPVPTPLPLHLTFDDDASRRAMKDGWQRAEVFGGRPFVWSEGLKSVLTVPLPATRDIQMVFEVTPFAYPGSPPQSVTIVLNGSAIETVRLRSAVRRYSVILPSNALHDSNTLEFTYAYARAPHDVIPNAQDRRVLAVSWQSIDFVEKSR